MSKRARSAVGHAAVLAVTLGAAPCFALPIPLGPADDVLTLNVGALLQPQLRLTTVPPPEPNPSGAGGYVGEAFLRRARLMVSGTVARRVSFLFVTDLAFWGRGGRFDQPLFVQDAVVSIEWWKDHYIDLGSLLVPYTHLTGESATALLSSDFVQTVARPAATMGKVWHDTGVVLRGFLFEQRLQYRVGAFEGSVANTVGAGTPAPSFVLNPSSIPRVAGTLRVNLLGRERDMFTKGIYFTEEPLLSVGGGVDYQHAAVAGKLAPADYLAAFADVFADIPIGGDLEAVAQVAYYHHEQGDALPANSGHGLAVEAGLRWRLLTLSTLDEYFRSDDRVAAQDIVALHGGLAVWIRRHAANVKLDVGWTRTGAAARSQGTWSSVVQAQACF